MDLLLKHIPHIQRIHFLFGPQRLRFPAWTELGNTQETVSEKIGCNEYQINQQTTKKEKPNGAQRGMLYKKATRMALIPSTAKKERIA